MREKATQSHFLSRNTYFHLLIEKVSVVNNVMSDAFVAIRLPQCAIESKIADWTSVYLPLCSASITVTKGKIASSEIEAVTTVDWKVDHKTIRTKADLTKYKETTKSSKFDR
jgi:hypothetical protein